MHNQIERITEQLYRSKRLKCDYQEAECKSSAKNPTQNDIEILLNRSNRFEKEIVKLEARLEHEIALSKERHYWAAKYRKECLHWRKGTAQCMHCKRPIQP